MTTTEVIHRTQKPLAIVWVPFTWIELGLWSIFVLGAFLGAFKRHLPISDSLITLAYDGLCFGLLGFVLIKRLAKSWRLPYSTLTPPVLIFCGFSFLTILNPELTSPIRGLLGWRFLASGLLLHFLGFYAFGEIGRIWRLLKVFWVTSGVVALYGIVQLVKGYTAVELAWIESLAATMRIAGTGRYRLMSTLGSAVDLGFFITLAIVTLFGVLLVRKLRRNVIHLVLLGLMLFVLLYTFVRVAWVATFVGVAYLLVVRLWYTRPLRLLFPTFLFGIVTIIPIAVVIAAQLTAQSDDLALQMRVSSLTDPLADRSVQDRFRRWQEIWRVIQEYPLGIGVGMTGAASLKYDDEPSPAPVTMDNSYLKVLVETGWIGLGLFLWLLTAVLYNGFRIIKKVQGEHQLLAHLLVACFVAFVILLLFGEYIELNPARSIIWIFTGFLFCLPRLSPSQT